MSDQLTYDVRVHSIDQYKGKRGPTYRVRWAVSGRACSRSFATRKLAESFRASLLSAARSGEPFDSTTGLPFEPGTGSEAPTWFSHAMAFMDLKWDESSPRHRKSTAEGLVTLTAALVEEGRTVPDPAATRAALRHWAFNTAARRAATSPPDEHAGHLRWLEQHSLSLTALGEREGARRALQALSKTLDGRQVASSTLARKRAALSGAIHYAIELGHLSSNPLSDLRTKRQPRAEAVDVRVVVNPEQARSLLAAVKEEAPELHAFFACLYFAGLRPAEARNVREHDLHLPSEGWGEMVLHRGYQESGRAWTDTGSRGEERKLKHRNEKDSRPVPLHPELVRALRAHLADHGTGASGRLFVTRTGRGGHPIAAPYSNPVSMSTVYRVWRLARSRSLTSQQQAGPLARRPYDLRHACLSTWLGAGVPPTQVAAWAGHSVAVLLRTYAACLDGQGEQARKRIEGAMDH